MSFSQEECGEFVESSQNTSYVTRKLRPRQITKTSKNTPRQLKRKIRTRCSDKESCTNFEIPTSGTEESEVLNLSGSLFDGQHNLLAQYQEHENTLKQREQRDAVLEQVLEQSRKAYERLRLQSESKNLFSETNSYDNLHISRHRKVQVQEIGIQTTILNNVLQKNTEVQCEPNNLELREASIQTSLVSQKRLNKDASIQLSPEPAVKHSLVSVSTNTIPPAVESVFCQTESIETRDAAVQKYHSTRVREASVQVKTGELGREITKRNVGLQQRSSSLLELSTENILRLGIELKCDPAHLYRKMTKLAKKQTTRIQELSSSYLEPFGEADPYYANYAYFMHSGNETRNSFIMTECSSEHEMNYCIDESLV